jgi:hypothetical protein
MFVEIVAISEFNCPLTLQPGDTLKMVHRYQVVEDGPMHESELCRQDIPEQVTWTHSILFKLNGTLNHIIGDMETVAWVEAMAAND